MIAPLDQAAAIVRRRYHASAGSALYVLTTVFLAIGAINSQNNLLFFAFGIGAGALVVSGLVSGPALMGIRVRRDAPSAAEVGRPCRIRYTVQNRARLSPAFALTIRESPATRSSPAQSPRIVACVDHVGPGETVLAEATVIPAARGTLTLGPLSVSTTFPLGLARKSVHMSQHRTLVVRPRIVSIRPEILAPLTSAGARISGARPLPGFGEDIIGLREYQPGDSPRQVAWRASARADTLLIRQTAMPAPARVWVAIHASVTSLPQHDREIAISLAASVAVLADRSGFAVGLRAFGASILPKPGRRSIDRVLDALAEIEPIPERAGAADATVARDATIFIARTRSDARPGPGSLVLALDEAPSWLAPGQTLPSPPPPPRSRVLRAVDEFLGLDAEPPGQTVLAAGDAR
jgi:uncharacterized protein (DUF58 family)